GETIKEALHIRLFLEELGARRVGVPMPIHENNAAALEMALSDKHFSKAKHFQVRQDFVRDNCRPEEGLTPTATVIQTSTEFQSEDSLTKTLNKDTFKKFQEAMTTNPLCLSTREALLACHSSPIHGQRIRHTQVRVSHHRLMAKDIACVCHGGGGFGTSTHAETSKKLGDAGVLSGETGFRLVGCLRANKRSIARISAGSRKPWHVPRPDLSARISALQEHFCLSAAGRVGCHRSPSPYTFFASM
ncbi:MAG: hypothetical protein VXU42_03240, partial [Verrucomicrobiota bacterium]|nr:hypothetical protein [Verrucomicrobiota bacterium]